MRDEDVKVTLVCITYNHEDVLAEALESFVAQKTLFRYQVFVGDDNSTDRTPEILAEYAKNYPDIIIPFYREHNLGAQRNLVDLCERASSPYIAFCEGDDYFVDDYKLQKQYDYMEENSDLRACFHATEIVGPPDWYLAVDYNRESDGRIILPYSKKGYKRNLEVMDASYYISITPAHTSSYFFRWNYDLVIPEWYYGHFAGDHSMMMLQVGDGQIGVLPDVMSVYRRHSDGVYFHGDRDWHYYQVLYNWVALLRDIGSYFEEHYGDYCKPQIDRRIASSSVSYMGYLCKLDRLDDVRALCDDDESFEVLKTILYYSSKRAVSSKNMSRKANSLTKSMNKLNRRLGAANVRFVGSRKSDGGVSLRIVRALLTTVRRMASLRYRIFGGAK